MFLKNLNTDVCLTVTIEKLLHIIPKLTNIHFLLSLWIIGIYHSPSGTVFVPKFKFNKGKYTLVSPFSSLYFRFLFDSTSSKVF